MKYCIISLLFTACLYHLHAQDLNNFGRQKPVRLNGGVAVGSYFYDASGVADRQLPYGYSINAHASLNLYGVQIPFSVILNEQGRAFRQPFNRFGASPHWKWVQLHLGHRNLRLSPFTLAGQTMFMAGAALTPGKFRFLAAKGRFQKATGRNDPDFFSPRYRRTGLVFKAGYGGERGFLDIIFLKGKDDMNSLPGEPDSLLNLLNAQENSVLGITYNQSYFNSKLTFNVDAALSAFTEDLRYEPIDFSEEVPAIERFNFLMKANGTTHLNYAGESRLSWQDRSFGIAAVYRRVMPQFKSMGVNYLLTDQELLTLNPSLTLNEGRLLLNSSIGVERNNLDENRAEDTRRIVSSFDVNYNPGASFGIFAQYANYTVRQQVFRDEFSNDSLLVNQINHNVTLSPRYSIFGSGRVHNILLSLNYQSVNDNNRTTADLTNSDLFNAFLNYVVSISGTGFNLRAGLNYFKYNSKLFENGRYGVSGGVSKKFKERGITVGSDIAVNVVDQQGQNGLNISATAIAEYAFAKNNSLAANIYFLRNDSVLSRFSEIRGQLRYNYRF